MLWGFDATSCPSSCFFFTTEACACCSKRACKSREPAVHTHFLARFVETPISPYPSNIFPPEASCSFRPLWVKRRHRECSKGIRPLAFVCCSVSYYCGHGFYIVERSCAGGRCGGLAAREGVAFCGRQVTLYGQSRSVSLVVQ